MEVVHTCFAVVDGAHQLAEFNCIGQLLIAKDRWRVLDAAVGASVLPRSIQVIHRGPAIQAFCALVVLQKNAFGFILWRL